MDQATTQGSQNDQDIFAAMDEVEKRKEAAAQRKEEMRLRAQERQTQDPSPPYVDATNPLLPPVTTPVPQQLQAQPVRPLREDQIRNAIEFLQDPRIIPSPLDRKKKFLQSKGLTDEEINEAIKRVGVQQQPQQVQLIV